MLSIKCPKCGSYALDRNPSRKTNVCLRLNCDYEEKFETSLEKAYKEGYNACKEDLQKAIRACQGSKKVE